MQNPRNERNVSEAELVRDKLTGPLGMTGVAFTTKDLPGTAVRAGGHPPARSVSSGP